MKSIVVDSSSIISLTSNCLLWTLQKLKEASNVHWIISESVRQETVERAIGIPRFQLVGTRVLRNIASNTLEVVSKPEIDEAARRILSLANSIYTAGRDTIKVLQKADSEVLAIAHNLGSKALLTDERVMRLVVEEPQTLRNILSSRLHRDVGFDSDQYKRLGEFVSDVFVLRSAEVVAVAYENGIYDSFIDVAGSGAKRKFLEGMFWGLKFSGCAMRADEIDKYVKMLIGDA